MIGKKILLVLLSLVSFNCASVKYYNSVDYIASLQPEKSKYVDYRAVRFALVGSDSENKAKEAKFNTVSGFLHFNGIAVHATDIQYLKYSNTNLGPHFGVVGGFLGVIPASLLATTVTKTDLEAVMVLGILWLPTSLFTGRLGHILGDRIKKDWQELDLEPYRKPKGILK